MWIQKMRRGGSFSSWLPSIVIFLSILPSYFAQCPSDARWVYNNNDDQCYFPFPSVNTWTWCEATCATNSMTMLCIDDYNQNEFVLTNFLSTSSYIPVGLRDENMNFMFSWTSGCMSSYNPWAYEEPSHSPNEYCVYTSNDGFTNRKCDNNGASDITCVCQISSSLTTEVEPQAPMDPGAMINLCPNDWVYEPDSATCFYFDRTPDSWEWCNAFCTANGVEMPCVMNQMQNDFLRNQIAQLDFDGIMLGYSDQESEGQYYWDGAPSCTSTYTNWLQNGEPFSEFHKNCVLLRTTYGNFWETSICTTLLNSDDVCACQGALNSVPTVMNDVSAPEVRCPEGWELDRDADKCYYIIPAVTSWDWCQATCSANTVSMISIDNMFDQSFLLNMKVASGNDIFPLGLLRDGPSSPFGWWDEHFYNSGWGTNSPNANTTADCAYLWYGDYGWENAACSGIADVTCVCEAAGTEAPATMNSVPDPNAVAPCPAGWEYYADADKCYLADTSDSGIISWDRCDRYCSYNGANMVCVQNAGENAFVEGLKAFSSNVIPLGLSDPQHDGTFGWNSGCLSTYTNWHSNEPSNGTDQHCAFMWGDGDQWNDAICDPFSDVQCVCEASPATAPIGMEPFEPCPFGWEYYPADGKCYYVEETMRTWLSCNSFCAVNGVGMLCVENSGQNDFLLSLKSDYGDARFPLGLSDPTHVGTFTWQPGCSSSYTAWNSNEPTGYANEYCSYMWTGSYGWNDATCDTYFGATDRSVCVCESTPEDAPLGQMNATSPCPPDWEYFADSAKCYYVNSVYTPVDSWSACNSFCLNNSVSMPCVANAGENLFLDGLRQVTGSIFPLGLSDPQHDGGSLEWNAGCTSTYANWFSGQPDHGTNEYCAYLWADGDQWKDDVCGQFLNNFQCVCEAPPATAPLQMVYNPCPAGWEYYPAEDKCYYVNTVNAGLHSWNGCKQYCDANSVDMLCVQDDNENSFIAGLKPSLRTIFPLGLSDPQEDGSLQWNAGCSSTHDSWYGGQPSYGPDQFCAYMWENGAQWNDEVCTQFSNETMCVCESAPASAPAVMVYEPCPTGWLFYEPDNKCYFLEPAVRTWVSCRTYCATNDVDMLCIENSGQNDYFEALKISTGPTVNFPIGFSDPNHDGTYTWQPGCTSSFTAWTPTEPSQTDGVEYCAFIWGGNFLWNDAMCNYNYGDGDKTVCVCEAAPEEAPLTMSAASPCPAGWEYFADSDKCYFFDPAPRSWEQCSDFCDANGVTLPCVENTRENAYLQAQKVTEGFDGISLGYSKASSGDPFAWTSGCASTYAAWDSGNPVSTADYYCAMLKTGGAAVWVNYPCDTQYEAGKTCVCESPPATAPSVMVSPCPAGWHQYSADGKCYYLPEYASYSWDQCAGFCDANGVDMICAENAGQANFIRGVVGNSWVALGLKDNVGDGSYAWNAGCSSAYIAWASGEPTGGDERCAAIAPDGYADSYCSQPLEFFRCGCESTPTLAPVTMVGELRPALPSMLSSATYVVRNGFAFAALANDTSVHTWGEAGMGGNSSSVQAHLQSGVVGIVHSKFAFAALAFDGTVYGWGDSTALVNTPTLDTIILMVGNGEAFACRSNTDRGVTSGSPHSGGVIPVAYSDLLTLPKLRALAASSGAFAALMSDATVFAWGNQYTGGGVDLNPVPNLTSVVKVVANLEAFAAIDSFGGVTTWGAALSGGDSSSVASGLSQVVHVIGTRSAFAAFKADGSLVVWGYWKDGGDASAVSASLSSGVVAVAHTYTAMAALKADGTAVTWGRDTDGGDSSGVSLANLVSIVGNSKAFVAITASGGVMAWGRAAFGGAISTEKVSALSSGVVSIYHTDRAFAALKTDQSVVAWGQAGHGGSPGATVEALLAAGIHTVCANDAAFSAINAAGEVIAWGHPVVVPIPGVIYQSNSLMMAARCSAEVGGAVREGGNRGGGSGGPTRV